MASTYNNFLNHYNRQFSQTKKQQEDTRAQAFYEQEQKISDEKKQLHDDPASLWGGDVGLALARVVNYAQQSSDDKLQDLIMSLEYEMHAQMVAVQEGIDELKQRMTSNEKEIEEERNLIAGQLSLLKGGNNSINLSSGAATPSSNLHTMMSINDTKKRSASLMSQNSDNSGFSFFSGGANHQNNNHNASNSPTSTSRPPTGRQTNPMSNNAQQHQKQDSSNEKEAHHDHHHHHRKLSIPPTIKSLDKISHTLHTFPMLIAESLWRELKCETVNIYVKGKDNASNLLYSVPSRSHDPHTFKRLHRSVETAVFQHQVAVCAWDAASKQQQNMYSASTNDGRPMSASSSTAMMQASITNSGSSHQHHPQSYVAWPIVLVDDESNNNNNKTDEFNNGGKKPTSPRSYNKSGVPSRGQQQQQQSAFENEKNNNNNQHQQGARYKTVACIECVNKKISSYSMLAASINSSSAQHQLSMLNQSATLNNNNKTDAANLLNMSVMMGGTASLNPSLANQVKMQFSKTDEALIASAAKLMASCFENFPSSASPSDEYESHNIISQFAKTINSNVQPLPHENPSVNIPSAKSAVESAVMSMAPIKLFRGPSAGVFKPTVGHQTSDKVPSSPYALANVKEAKPISIDSFTHDGNLRSLEASISYLDSMWKAAFSDNVGMHEECRKLSTKIRDLSFICSQVEECFAAARKMNSIDDIRSFLRTAELSLKSGSRALLGTAMKISLESQINSDDHHPKDHNNNNKSSTSSKQQPKPPSTAPITRNNNNAENNKNDTNISINEIHVDGPEGLRHYTVDPATKKAQMEAIISTMESGKHEAAQYHINHPRSKHSNHESSNNNNNSRSSARKNNASSEKPSPASSPSRNNNNTGTSNNNNTNTGGGGHSWLRHHQNASSTPGQGRRDISTPKSLQSVLPKIPPMPSK